MEELHRRIDAQQGQIAALNETVLLLVSALAHRDARAASWAQERLATARAIARASDASGSQEVREAFFDAVNRRLQGASI